MQNTLENKALFFSLFKGQRVIKHSSDRCLFLLNGVYDLTCVITGDFSGGTHNVNQTSHELIENCTLVLKKQTFKVGDKSFNDDVMRFSSYFTKYLTLTEKMALEYGWMEYEKSRYSDVTIDKGNYLTIKITGENTNNIEMMTKQQFKNGEQGYAWMDNITGKLIFAEDGTE